MRALYLKKFQKSKLTKSNEKLFDDFYILSLRNKKEKNIIMN
jgi:hypothetical protein